MSYPYNQLGTDEDVVLHEHSHWKTLILPLAAAAVIVAGCGYLAAVVAGQPWRHPAWIALAALAGIGSLWFGLTPWLRWRSSHFVVTTDKVMVREGVLARTGMTIPLSRIATVQTKHDINDRLFGCGTLIVESYSAEPVEFTDIPDAEHVSSLLYQLADGTTTDQLIAPC